MVLTTVRQRWHDVHIKTAWMTQDTLDLITLGDAPLLRSIKCDVLGFPERGISILLYMLHSCPRLELFHWKSSGSRLT
ncbi:hypothetical protein BD779DRAFT_1508958 [Infundibulicybe gibba]|nr:hypothetical protein BD779DRAFT_1508958 [Infundibulicybe gibba]